MDINLWNLKEMPFKVKTVLLIILLNLSFSSAGAQEDDSLTTDSLPLDNSIRYGRLSNGFTYFIKSLQTPQSKLYLRLYNKAGMDMEDPDQLSLAHAVEHLAFKDSKNFSSGIRTDDHLTGMGMDMFDLYAYTARKNVTYFFDAPPGSEEAMNLGFRWFKDIVDGLKLTDEDIEQVRGELRQEAMSRMGDNLVEHFTEGELYSRLFPCPQNAHEILNHYRTFTPESLRRFYRDWYRPNLFAISVVGHVEDMDKMENKIKETFSNIDSDKDQRKLKDCDAGYYKRAPQFVTIKRPKDTSRFFQNSEVYVSLFFRDPVTSQNLHKMSGVMRLNLMQMLVDVVRGRFREATNEYKSAYLGVKHLYEIRALPPALEIVTKSENGMEEEVIKKAIKVLHQIQKFGVLETEWHKMKQKQLRFINPGNEETPEYWNNEIMRYYVYGEALPSQKSTNLEMWLEDYSLDEFNDFIRHFLSNGPTDIGITAPAESKALSYAENEVRSWIAGAYKAPVEPFKVPEIKPALMSKEEVEKLKNVAYVEKGRGPSGAMELELGNGVKVVFKSVKPTSGTQTRLNLHGFSLKGANCFRKENYFSAVNAPEIVENSGVKGLDRFQLQRFLLSTGLRPGSVSPYIHDRETGIYANATTEDLETALQLIYLYFTTPNKNKEAFEDWQVRQKEAFQNPSYDLVGRDFSNAIQEFLGENPGANIMGRISRAGTRSFEGVNKTDLDKAFKIYEMLFGDAKDFTFILSGNFDIESTIPLVQKYLGNLPNSNHLLHCSTRRNEKELPVGPILIEIPAPKYYRMKNVIYGTRFIEKSENSQDWQEQLRVEALGAITNKKLWSLRYGKGYSLYSFGARGYYNSDTERYEISVKIDCIPEELPDIRKELKQIFSNIKSGLISEGEFQQGIQRMYSLYDAERANLPRVIAAQLYNYYRYNESWLDPVEVERFVKSLTINDIIETANKYYKKENLFEFTMTDDGL